MKAYPFLDSITRQKPEQFVLCVVYLFCVLRAYLYGVHCTHSTEASMTPPPSGLQWMPSSAPKALVCCA